MNTPYHLLTRDLDLNPWPKRWLALAVLALGLAGVFSIILVVSRTPQLIEAFPAFKALFQVSLVVHVDLSVLVWFLAMTGMLWAMLQVHARPAEIPFFNRCAWMCMLAGTMLIAVSPITGEWEVIKSNYIPVLTNLVFFVGLGLVMASVIIGIVQSALAIPKRDETRVVGWGIYLSIISTGVAMALFVASYLTLPVTLEGQAFYETVFWAGGHVLQFTYVQSMLVAWCLIAWALGLRLPPNPILMLMLFVGPFFTLTSFVPYLIFEVTDQQHMDFFTLQMNVVLGIGGVVLGLWIVWQMIFTPSSRTALPEGSDEMSQQPQAAIDMTYKKFRAIRSSLIMSLVLFFAGGALGSSIVGSNTTIPAHYHGSIVAVTLALMGLAYALLPSMGGKQVGGWRLARVQPWLYGVGQLMHIGGLGYSGGYGVLRKTAGDVGDGSADVYVALGIMGTGGLLAIIGGLLFVIVMVRGFRKNSKDFAD